MTFGHLCNVCLFVVLAAAWIVFLAVVALATFNP